MAGEQTSEPVSAAVEAGPQVARRQRSGVGSVAPIRCQQGHFLTMSIHKQASQQRHGVLGGMKNRPRAGFTKEEATVENGGAHLLIKTPIKISLSLARPLFSHTHADASAEVGRLQAAQACLGC